MKTPYYVASYDDIRICGSNRYFETRDEAEYHGKQKCQDPTEGSHYVFELVSVIDPPGPAPEVKQF